MVKPPPLRVFVAMPGTDMGMSSPWKNVEEIKKHFFQPIRSELEKQIEREVVLVIEKDKLDGAIIHDSMFAESWQADVYIADLSGNNANVYLELGVRWAVRDAITVVVTQNLEEILGRDSDALKKLSINELSDDLIVDFL